VVEEGRELMIPRLVVAVLALAWSTTGAGRAAGLQAPADKVPIVAVSGCVSERAANSWVLTHATEPTPSIANAPPANAPITGPTTGKLEFALIGVSEFDLPSHKGHTVLVKALLIKASPVSRLNVTSVTHIAPTCPPTSK
jgi:hypothetical protein